MKDFLLTLYSNESFPIYLGLFIVVLVIAFVVVYFWGHKDKKLIETRKLEKLHLEDDKQAFKEISKKQKVEVKEPKNSSYEYTETIELPRLNKDSGVKTVSIENINQVMEENDEPTKNDEVEFLYEDTKEIVLPKLK